MKYKNFDEWFDAQGVHLSPGVITLMRDAWDGCVDNYEQNAAIGHKIHELLTTLKDAMKIDCTCDKSRIKHGYPCICARAGAIMQATKELGAYLQKLRKEIK